MKKVFFRSVKNGASPKEIASTNLELLKMTGKLDEIKPKSMVAIKMHFGDSGNIGHIKPETVRALVEDIKMRNAKPFLVETSTLYVGARSNAYDHITTAFEHGFTYEKVGAPIIMADGLLGHGQVEVEVNGHHCKKVRVASDVPHYDFIIFLSHVTGHIITGIGATIKNIGMGLSARGGKLAQHSDVKPSIVAKKCKKCGRCQFFCPAEAISEAGASYVIDREKCIGCGECIAICKFDAVKFSWKQSSKIVQEKMAEYALGVVGDKVGRCIFANHIVHVTKECDCMAKDEATEIPDVGIAVCEDPVALDAATVEIVKKRCGYRFDYDKNEPIDPWFQLNHAETIGLGSKKYELIEK